MGKLVIESLQKKIKLRKLAKAVYAVLGQKARFKAELVFESEDGIQVLNRRARGVDSVTDVLSFPTLEGIKGEVINPENCVTEMEGRYIFIGSIVLCEEKIKEQGGHVAELSAQKQAENFYLSLGYIPMGDIYYDQHAPHIHMEKEL